MLTMYPAIFYKEQDGMVSVVFPDLNHLATCGDDLQEAMEMAIDCLAAHVYSAWQDGEILPAPTPAEEVDIHCEDDEDDDYLSAFVSLVAVDVAEYADKHFEKSVKKTLTIPDWLNRRALDKGINFSAVLKNRLAYIVQTGTTAPAKNPSGGLLSAIFASTGKMPLVAAAVAPMPIAAAFVAGGANQKSVKKTLTLPKWLNERASAMDINFSAVLRDALIDACQDKSK